MCGLRTGGWSLPSVMSDWQRCVDWFLAKYCRGRLRLDWCWCRWRTSAKGRRRWGLMVWRRQVGLVRGTQWPAESSVGRMVEGQRDEVMDGFLVEPQNQGRAGTMWEPSHEWRLAEATPSSRGLQWFTRKPLGSLVDPHEEPKMEVQQLQTGLTGEEYRSDRCATMQSVDFKVEDTRRDRKACVEAKQVCSCWASVRWSDDKDFRIRPQWACIPNYLVMVFKTFGCLHITQEVRGWQPTLGTLAHLVFLFSLPIFSRISIRLAWELHGEILWEGWMIRRQARPCMNLFVMYKWFGVVPQGLDVLFPFVIFGDFWSPFLVILLERFRGRFLEDLLSFVILFSLIPLPNPWEKGLDFGVFVVLRFGVFLAEILRFLLFQRVLVDHNLAMECPWGVPSIPKVLFETVERIERSGVGFGGVDPRVLFIPSCPGLTGLTGVCHLWDLPRMSSLTRVFLGRGVAGQFLVCLELFC
jgi:hypothetical protein